MLPDPSKPSVLFVDDEIRVIRSLKVLFSIQNEFNIFTATSAAEALGLVKAHRINVIVSDQRMPGQTGVELLKQARGISPCSIGILLTGYADLDAIIASINEGEVFRYLTKPWKNRELKEKISQAVNISVRLYQSSNMPKLGIMEDAEKIPPQNILVIHPKTDVQIASMVSQLYEGRHYVHTATDFGNALELLAREACSVVVTDIHSHNANITSLIKLLKQAQPAILAVVIAASADANVVISLINQGQIYRFLPKPVQTGRLKLSVSSALRYSRRIREVPVMAEKHQVEAPLLVDEVLNSPGIREKLTRIRKRFLAGILGKHSATT